MKVHYPKLYNMAHLSLNVFTASKGSNNYILFMYIYVIYNIYICLYNKKMLIYEIHDILATFGVLPMVKSANLPMVLLVPFYQW